MGEPRKIFRIEQTAAARLEQCSDNAQGDLHYARIVEELSALRALFATASARTRAAAPEGGETSRRLTSELNVIAGAIGSGDGTAGTDKPGGRETAAPMTRIGNELKAVVNGTEQATQKILAAAEEIDQLANNLSAALKGSLQQGSAQDIADLVIRIFEACNFQDLVGQRVAKVMVTLKFIEDHIARVLDEIKNASTTAQHNGEHALHGPQLEGDRGHASQREIDALFAGGYG
jgi:chemotaxis protein CheZ